MHKGIVKSEGNDENLLNKNFSITLLLDNDYISRQIYHHICSEKKLLTTNYFFDIQHLLPSLQNYNRQFLTASVSP